MLLWESKQCNLTMAHFASIRIDRFQAARFALMFSFDLVAEVIPRRLGGKTGGLMSQNHGLIDS